MLVRNAGEKIGLRLLAGKTGIDKELTGVYICDLLSWVMAHGSKGDAWITVQTHANIIAVATLLELSCIIVPEEVDVEERYSPKGRGGGSSCIPVKLKRIWDCKRTIQDGN